MNNNHYRIIAFVLALIGTLTFVASWMIYASNVGWSVVPDAPSWGQFGDFIGGFVGTVIALSTLVALALTLFLQARALDETKAALSQQTAATNLQIALTERTEALKLRPLLKAEWFRTPQPNRVEWRVLNIGLGPAILDRIELFNMNQKIGEHPMEVGPEWIDAWRDAVLRVLTVESDPTIFAAPMSYLTRGLAAGEYQAMMAVALKTPEDTPLAVANLNTALEVVIHFRSMAGESLNTKTQFDFTSRS